MLVGCTRAARKGGRAMLLLRACAALLLGASAAPGALGMDLMPPQCPDGCTQGFVAAGPPIRGACARVTVELALQTGSFGTSTARRACLQGSDRARVIISPAAGRG